MQTQSFGDYDQSPVGTVYKAVCKMNRGYEHHLTNDKIYIITITPRILPMSPLCSFIGDKGKTCECHLYRFHNVIKE